MTDKILAILLNFAPFHAEPHPESPEVREARLETASAAIWRATEVRPRGLSRATWAGVLVALGWHESRFAAYVGNDQCSEGPDGARCDDGRAKSYFQAHRSVCPRLWTIAPESEEWQHYAARCASGRLTGAYARCRSRAASPLAGAFSGYAGASCTWRGAPKRAQSATRFAVMLGG